MSSQHAARRERDSKLGEQQYTYTHIYIHIYKQVNTLLEESAIANSENKLAMALEKAKEAAKKERQLCKYRESNNLGDQMNIDLTYAICFNLANQYQVRSTVLRVGVQYQVRSTVLRVWMCAYIFVCILYACGGFRPFSVSNLIFEPMCTCMYVYAHILAQYVHFQ